MRWVVEWIVDSGKDAYDGDIIDEVIEDSVDYGEEDHEDAVLVGPLVCWVLAVPGTYS